MKIKLTESQFERLKKIGFLTEQTDPFYAQEKTSSGAINPNSDYRYSGGGPMARPQGAIDVKFLFPSQVPQGGYPQKLTQREVTDILAGKAYKGVVRNSLNNTVAPQITPQIRDAIQGKPPTPLPWDWQREEQNYAAFNEPLGKPDRMVTGKYRGNRGPLPAQTNKYFYNPSAKVSSQQKGLNSAGKSVTQTVTTNGAWEVKTLENVNLWRDVPKGYYPPDYPKALAFDKEYKAPANSNSAESTGVNKNLRVKINPYFTPQFPLGLSQEAINARKSMIDAKNKEFNDIKNQPTQTVAGSDYFASVAAQNKQKAQQIIFNKIQNEKSKIDASFGKYVASQNKEEGYDWVGFLLTIASILPVVGPAATVLNIGYNLANAVRAYEKGDYAEAGLNTLFAVLPSLSKTLKGTNLFNVLRAGGQEAVALEKYLAQNASTWYSQVVGGLTQNVEQNVARYATNQEVLLTIEKSIGKFTEQYSLKGAAKATAGEVDKYAKGKTDVINPLKSYIPGM